MRRAVLLLQASALAMLLTGCGSSEPPKPAADNSGAGESPDRVVYAFLQAVKNGDDAKAASLLSPLARERTAAKDLEVAPPGSDTASFQVGQFEIVGEGGAHVASVWTDLDEEGKPRSDEIVWMVRQEDEGWRIVGMATKLFPDEPPLFLNFEDPDDMIRKQNLAIQEIERRANGGAAPEQAQGQPAPLNAANATGVERDVRRN